MSDQQHKQPPNSPHPDRTDVYTRVPAQIVAELAKGVRPWLKPWDAGHMAEGWPAMLTREHAHAAFGFLARLALALAAFFALRFAAGWLVRVAVEPCCRLTDNLPARIARLERRYGPPDPPRPPAPPRQAKR